MSKPSANTQPNEKKDSAATPHLFQALPEQLILQVANYKIAKETLDALMTRDIGVD